jgi:hypothetical protein
MYYAKRSVGLFAITALAAASALAVRQALADWWARMGTPEGIARAMKLDPRNASYLAIAASITEAQDGDAGVLWEQAAVQAPLASAPKIRLGLEAEVRGHEAAAEKWLLEAARVDRQFEPAWTLANFYFRAGRTAEFWKWARAALAVSYGDRRPLFELCRRASSDPLEILRRAIPDRAEVAEAYLHYLLDRGATSGVPAAAHKLAIELAAGTDPRFRPVLLRACDALVEANRFAGAAAVWEALGEPRPFGVTHPDFEAPRTGQGFDWRWTRPAGVAYMALDDPPGLRLVLNGRQPEAAVLLRQAVGGFQPGTRYRLSWLARTNQIREPTGLSWQIAGQAGAVTASPGWREGELTFRPSADLSWLEFVHQRPSGETRAEGTVELRRLHITRVP